MSTPAAGRPDPDAIVEQVHQALVRDHVYVDPSLASQVTPRQLTAIETAATSGDQPVFVVLYPFRDGDVFGGKPQDLIARLHDAHPAEGTYLATTTQLTPTDYSGIGIEGQSFGVPGADDFEGFQLGFIVEQEQQQTVGAAFARATELAARGPAAVTKVYDPLMAAHEQADDATGTTSSTGSSPDGGGSGVLVGAGSGIVAVLALVAVGVAVRRRRAAREQRTFTLPESALEHIRAAHDRRLEQQARDERLALGERIDATELHPHGQAAVAAWQAVLDQYDAAGRLLGVERPGELDVLDVVGALVLCRRARDALDAARRERSWTPAPTCYLDPLHGAATVTRVVESAAAGARSREVPLCRQCRADLDAGRRPDVLDVERHGRAVHYFESGVEPWASTGYGCFGDDLVAALLTARRPRGR